MGTAPLPSPLVLCFPKRNRTNPVGLFGFLWLPCGLVSCPVVSGRKRKRNQAERELPAIGRTETETKGRTEGRKGRTERRNETGRTAKGRTKQATPGRTFQGRKPEKKGTAFPPFLPSFLPFFPFSVPFPFLFARKKNYFSAFTLCFATFRKKSENK